MGPGHFSFRHDFHCGGHPPQGARMDVVFSRFQLEDSSG